MWNKNKTRLNAIDTFSSWSWWGLCAVQAAGIDPSTRLRLSNSCPAYNLVYTSHRVYCRLLRTGCDLVMVHAKTPLQVLGECSSEGLGGGKVAGNVDNSTRVSPAQAKMVQRRESWENGSNSDPSVTWERKKMDYYDQCLFKEVGQSARFCFPLSF